MQNPHGVENALLSGGEEAQRGASEDTRNSKRLKTKHQQQITKKNTNTYTNDNNEMEHTSKNPNNKNTRARSDSNPPEHLENSKEKNVSMNGANVNSSNEDSSDGGKKKEMGKEEIEKEFADLKEKFFKDKVAQLKKEVEAIKNGTHPQFCDQCKELDDIREEKIMAAEQWRKHQLQNITNMYEADKQQAEDECTTEKRLLKEKLINAILEKKKKLTEDKMTMNLTDTTDSRTSTNTRQLRRRGAPPPPAPAQVKKKLAPPSINYTLKDTEIQDDLNAIFNKREMRTR